MVLLLIQLLLAHMIGDFFLQPKMWVQDKEVKKLRSVYLYLHTAIHIALILLLTGGFTFWKIALLIGGVHFGIDSLKLQFQKKENKRKWFFIDQLLHLLSIVITWAFVSKFSPGVEFFKNEKFWVMSAAILFVLNPTSYIIRVFISKWSPNTNNDQNRLLGNAGVDESLEDAGKWIGMMERILILIFIGSGKWEGVGFLLAAKSIFRFGDLKEARDKKLTEYVLIGTMMSFIITIVVGMIAFSIIHRPV
ncbi:DUF3307 domain-containing protein [Ferruginibacter sp. HRS2-29]|uniref:DUF3307 domain-containing protein n=1 Tax=Ferruginibacter sp. HRS2-29 TaxID=2487334 RepID=UPI0020CC3651|nr:DUF3307 domain-containing protein [Ferruginibacter sp. HRS2-29]MCP9751226.1 DUF3307 domain-containing protein [Ferruginibacter sp. HRS2-29]